MVTAYRQMALSPHVPAFKGALPPTGHPSGHWHWYFESVEGPTLHDVVVECEGCLSEHGLLFAHWRQQIVNCMLHLSAMTTFKLTQPINLECFRVVEGGTRLVLNLFERGGEFAEQDGYQEERDYDLLKSSLSLLLTMMGLDPDLSQSGRLDCSLQLRSICLACQVWCGGHGGHVTGDRYARHARPC